MSLDPRLELLEPIEDPIAQRHSARFAGKPAEVWIANAETPRLVHAQLSALANADLPRSLRSPYLGRVLHGGNDEDGMPYLVVEAVDATTLEQRMLEGPAFKATDAVRMIVDLLGGMAALEKLDLHHGAVEPGNIRVIDASRGSTLRLFHLGANARGVRTGQIDADGVTTAAALAYTAPEQARGDLGSEVSADAFSTIAVLYTLLSGHLPFSGATAEAVLSSAANSSPPSLAEARPELAGALTEAVDRALSSDVSERFGSIAELQRALRGALLKSPTLRSLETVVGEPQGAIAAPVDEPADDTPDESDENELDEATGDEPAAEDEDTGDDEFGVDDAFDETFGDSPAEPAEPADEPFEDEDDEEEEESTRVGLVSPSLLAAMEDDEDDDDEDEPTRVGAVSADLIAQTLPEIGEDHESSATRPGSAALLEVLNLRAEMRDSAPPAGSDAPEADASTPIEPSEAAEAAEATATADTNKSAPRLSERPAGALPVQEGTSPLSGKQPADDGGGGWVWMLVAALVIAAAVAAGMMYGS